MNTLKVTKHLYQKYDKIHIFIMLAKKMLCKNLLLSSVFLIFRRMKKVRKSFRNFILSRIAKAHKDQEFLDVNLMTSQTGEMVSAHKFVLAASSPVISSALHSITNYDEDSVIVFPDFGKETLQTFILLIYGHLSLDLIERSKRQPVLELCQILGTVAEI